MCSCSTRSLETPRREEEKIMKIKADVSEFFVQVSGLGLTWDLGTYETRQEALEAIEASKADYELTGNHSAYRYDYKIIERLAV